MKLARIIPLAALAAVVIVASFGPTYYLTIAITICYYLLLAVGWNIIAGYAGLPSFAQVAFASLAGYVSGLSIGFGHLPVFAGIALGIGFTAGTAIALGYGSVKLTGTYFALATIAFSEGFRQFLYADVPLSGGGAGYFTIPLIPNGNTFEYYYLFVGVAAVGVYLSYRLVKSNLGLLMRSIGSDEQTAAVVGVNVSRIRLYAFFISALYAATAGLLYVHFNLILFPDHGSLTEMATVVVIVLFGGLGTVLGPVAGSFIIILVREYVISAVGPYDILVFGVIIIIMMRFARAGVIGTIESFMASRKRKELEAEETR
ncbi:MAG: branched-chain amino acid ABC transporter permease, partial [Nitrososphaerales archaeon]